MIEETDIAPLVERFYSHVRSDPDLGPVFGELVHDWPDHHLRLTDFWSSVMFASGRYKGNPVALHMRHAEVLTPDRFKRWLALWQAASNELLPEDAALAVQAKAKRIAESLQLAIGYRSGAKERVSAEGGKE